MNWRANFESMDELGEVIYVLSRLRLALLLKIRSRIHIEKDGQILNLTQMIEIFHCLKF